MDVLAWSYADLKSFKPKDVQHDIPLKEDARAFRQKAEALIILRFRAPFRPKFRRCWTQRINFPIHHSTWVANIVP
ncbi:hypothetical protein KI387_001785, partial [Taxus chinensis]